MSKCFTHKPQDIVLEVGTTFIIRKMIYTVKEIATQFRSGSQPTCMIRLTWQDKNKETKSEWVAMHCVNSLLHGVWTGPAKEAQ
jgi:hypothetical protein